MVLKKHGQRISILWATNFRSLPIVSLTLGKESSLVQNAKLLPTLRLVATFDDPFGGQRLFSHLD